MRKMMRVARREYAAQVRTKGFIIGLAIAPLFMGGSAIAMIIFENRADTRDRVIAVVDRSGSLADSLVAAATSRNENEIHEKETRKHVKPA